MLLSTTKMVLDVFAQRMLLRPFGSKIGKAEHCMCVTTIYLTILHLVAYLIDIQASLGAG